MQDRAGKSKDKNKFCDNGVGSREEESPVDVSPDRRKEQEG